MTTRINRTHTIEDYLKTIYSITANNSRASTNQIALALDVTPASVTGMMKKLADNDPPLVEYQSHRGVVLTPDGERIALEVLRHHRLLELFLHQILGYDWDQVHVEAERLEHVISEEFEERIAQVLGHPSHDPHGDPIPDHELIMPSTSSQKLIELRTGQSAKIHRVANENPEFLRYLGEIGLVPGARIQIADFSQFDHNLTLYFDATKKTVTVGPRITSQVYVEIIG